MPRLSGPQHKKLQDAIVVSFRDTDLREMREMLWQRLELSLEDLAGPGTLRNRIFELIGWFERQGRTRELLDALEAERPHDEDLLAVVRELRGGPAPTAAKAAPVKATPATQPPPAVLPGPAAETDRVQVLFFAANPDGVAFRDADEETRDIEAKIRAAAYRDVLHLTTRRAARPDDLLQSLNQDQPAVVHFASLGSKAGEIILQDDSRQPRPVRPAALAALFRTLRGRIRVVVLSGCYSQPQAEAIAKEIDCVVGVGPEVACDAARVFAASFYRALGFGNSVQNAFEQGNIALMLKGDVDEGAAHLLARQGVDPATVVLVRPDGGARSPTSPPAPIPAATPTATPATAILDTDDYVEILRHMLRAHFDLVVNRVKIGPGILDGPQATQAIDLVNWAEQSGKLPDLHKAIEKYAPGALTRKPAS